jgi:hypothetical protein
MTRTFIKMAPIVFYRVSFDAYVVGLREVT